MTLLASNPEPQAFLLRDVSWELYETLLRELGDQKVFLTYDHGSLELMSPSWKHERYAELFGSLIRIIAGELKLPLIGGGSTTFRSRQGEVGLEPDRCFYVRHAAAVKGKRELDLTVDPPPDLVVEIEVSRRMIDRLDLYATLGVPEVWRCDGKRLEVLVLSEQGYSVSDRSPAFPGVRVDQIVDLIEESWTSDETAWAEVARRWVGACLQG